MSNLVTRILSAATEPPISPRVTSIFEPGQDLKAAAPPWLGEADEGSTPRRDPNGRVSPRVDGPAGPTRAIAVTAAEPVPAERQRAAPLDDTVDSSPPDLPPAPLPSRPAERAIAIPGPTAEVPAPVPIRPLPNVHITAVERAAAAALPTADTARAPRTGAPSAAAAAARKTRTPDTRATTTQPLPSRVEPLAALPGSHPIQSIVAALPASVVPALSRRTTTRENNDQHSVQVTIGRVEVRASRSQEQTQPTAAAAGPSRRPLLSLEDYLGQRSGGVST